MDFTQINNVLNSGSTGIFVSLVLSLASFVTERKSTEKQSTVDEYKEWLRIKDHKEIIKGQAELLVAIENQDEKNEQTQLINSTIECVMHHVENHADILNDIAEQTKLLPDMNAKLNFLVDKLSQRDSPTIKKGQLAVCAIVLDKLTEGLVGSGVKVMMEKQLTNVNVGTIMVAWLIGTQSPQMMLVDFVGSIYCNRISLILNSNSSITLQVYDSDKKKTVITSIVYSACQYLVIFAIWHDRTVSLWVNGKNQGTDTTANEFDYLGPCFLLGIDIEDSLSADAVRWTLPGEDVGLNFIKDRIWHGSRLDAVMIWDRVLNNNDIDTLTNDPFACLEKSKTLT